MKSLKPISDYVLIKPDDAAKETPGGIILPDRAKEKPQRGVVVAVGPGKLDPKTNQRQPVSVTVGDRVMYARYGGHEVEELKMILVTEDNIFGVITGG